MIFKSSRQLIHFFSCLLLGATLLLAADAISNNLMTQALPINMITTLIGAPIVIYLMFRNKQW
jgi:ABC-type Fe3+-siderophore transport system permease subunit